MPNLNHRLDSALFFLKKALNSAYFPPLFMPNLNGRFLVGIVAVGFTVCGGGAYAGTCLQAVVNTTTPMLNPSPSYCNKVSTTGYGSSSAASAQFGIYSCTECYSSTSLIQYKSVENEIDTSAYGYDCGTYKYNTCQKMTLGGGGNTLNECLSSCNSGQYCCPSKLTTYSCPEGWIRNLSTNTCVRSGTTTSENSTGYYTVSYGSCAATATTQTRYVVSASATITNDGVPTRCTACS